MESQESHQREKAIKAYWAFYQEFYYQTRYYEHYKTKCHRINAGVIVFLLASSMAGISGLWFWEQYPHIWAVIAAIVQVISASTFLMPHSEQSWALEKLLPEFDLLLTDVGHDWGIIEEKSNAEIFNLIRAYSKEMIRIEQHYIDSMYFPASKHCKKLASKEKEDFNKSTFSIENDTEEERNDKNDTNKAEFSSTCS